MNITDETLSAFLDSELPEQEMQAVRDRLLEDPALSDRLAALASSDRAVASHYSAIDNRPLPRAVTALLGQDQRGPAEVIEFPWWRRIQKAVDRRSGIAVAAALVMGFGLAQLLSLSPTGTDATWRAVAQSLETTPSGETRTLEPGGQLVPRLTFTNREGEYCRLFRVQTADRASENIACRRGQSDAGWVQVASVEVEQVGPANGYKAASGGSVLDPILDRMISGAVVGREQETRLLSEGWPEN